MLNRAVTAVLAPYVIPAVLLWRRRQAQLQVVSLQKGLTFMTVGLSFKYCEKYQRNNQNFTKSILKFFYCLFLRLSEIMQKQFSCFGQYFQFDEHPWLTSL